MKNIKTILALAVAIISIMSFSSSINAVANFELFNKSNEGIDFTLECGSNKQKLFVNPGEQKQATIGTCQTLYVIITGRASKQTSTWEIRGSEKTRYVTYNPAKKPYMYPQTGPLMGFLGKTESGLSLKSNVKQSDINEIIR